MLKAYKYRIFPTDEQKQSFAKWFGVSRLVYNLGLETKTTAYASSGKNVSKFELMKQLPDLKNEFEWIKDCPSQALQQSLNDLDQAYQNFFKNRASFPAFKNKYSKQSLRFPQGFSFGENTITLPKAGKIAVDYSRRWVGTARSVTLSKTATNKYFISVLVETGKDAPEKKQITKSTTVGIDLGIKNFAITSDGQVFENKHFLKKQLAKLRVEQRSLARKQKGSKNREKQKLKVALLHEKIRNQRTDYLHKVSTYLIQTYDTIALEDLSVSNMVKNRSLSKAISEMGWRSFRTMLEYKAEWYGKNIGLIGRFEPSSKICSNCGNLKKELLLSERTYNCGICNIELDRDINAALNIKNFWLRTQPINANVAQ